MAWVAERVAPYKRIRAVEIVDEIPKSASGKILRRLLRDRALGDRADGVAGGDRAAAHDVRAQPALVHERAQHARARSAARAARTARTAGGRRTRPRRR